jgi:hypothetical protein
MKTVQNVVPTPVKLKWPAAKLSEKAISLSRRPLSQECEAIHLKLQSLKHISMRLHMSIFPVILLQCGGGNSAQTWQER